VNPYGLADNLFALPPLQFLSFRTAGSLKCPILPLSQTSELAPGISQTLTCSWREMRGTPHKLCAITLPCLAVQASLRITTSRTLAFLRLILTPRRPSPSLGLFHPCGRSSGVSPVLARGVPKRESPVRCARAERSSFSITIVSILAVYGTWGALERAMAQSYSGGDSNAPLRRARHSLHVSRCFLIRKNSAVASPCPDTYAAC